MNLLKIYRISDNGIQTIGKAVVVDSDIQEISFECYSLELPWKNNKQKVSCIPTGKYACSKNSGTVKFPYEHFDIHNVPGRAGVKIFCEDFSVKMNGYVIMGSDLIEKGIIMDAVDSSITLKKLTHFLPNEFELQIINGIV